jgi:hypothetical protein
MILRHKKTERPFGLSVRCASDEMGYLLFSGVMTTERLGSSPSE